MITAEFSPVLSEAVKNRMSRGDYQSEEELLLAALEALSLQDSLDESIAASLADEAAGRVYPVEGLAERIRSRAKGRCGG
jgi:predicted transcriptional regulator